jgi:hypothetical protein
MTPMQGADYLETMSLLARVCKMESPPAILAIVLTKHPLLLYHQAAFPVLVVAIMIIGRKEPRCQKG